MTDFTTLPADLPAPVDDGAADHLPGTVAPQLTRLATDGRVVDFAALGEGRTVVYVYPLSGRPGVDLPEGWDAIPGARGCTPEACAFRDHYQELTAGGAARIYGLSSQDLDYQREFIDRLHLPFPMLSDADLTLAAALNLPTFTVDGAALYKRITLIFNRATIEHAFYPIFPPDQHAAQVLTWLHNADNDQGAD